MKQISVWLTATFLCIQASSQAQSTTLQDFFQKHKQDQGLTHALLSKDLFEIAAGIDVSKENWQGLHHVIQNLGSMEMLIGDSITSGISLYKEAKNCIPVDEFDELLTVRDGLTNVRMWAQSEENLISTFILLVGSPEEFVLICFTGAFNLGDISGLPALFEAGKTVQLAKTSATVSAEFSFFPNPANDQIRLHYNDPQDAPERIEILDANGKLATGISLDNSVEQSITLQSLKPGIYWVQLKTRSGKIGVKPLQIIR